jgi:hypothetical protein
MLAGGPVIIFRIPPDFGVGPVGVALVGVAVAVTVSGTEDEGAGGLVVVAAVVAAVVVTAGAVVAGVVVVPEQAVAMVALTSRITSNNDNLFNLPSLN